MTVQKIGVFDDPILDRQIEELVSNMQEQTGAVADFPATITSLNTTGGLGYIKLDYTFNSYVGHLHTEIFRSVDNDVNNAELVGASIAKYHIDTPNAASLNDVFFYWIRNVNVNGERGDLYGPVSGSIGADPSWMPEVLLEQLGFGHFEPGTYPVRSEPTFPILPSALYPVGSLIYLTTNGKLYRNVNEAWVAEIDAVDIIGQLTDEQIADIAAAKISGQLTDAQIADIASTKVTGQLTDAQIADIAAAKLTGQITETQITDNAISTPKLAAGSVSTAKIAAGAVTADEIAANAVTAAKIEAGAVVTAKIAAGAVTAGEIATNAVTATKVSAGAITTAKIAAGAVTADEIAANAITAVKIAAGAVTANEIAANTITADELATNSVVAGKIAAGALVVDDGVMQNGYIKSAMISDLAVTMAKIANAIQSDNFSSTQGFQLRKDTGAATLRQLTITDDQGNVVMRVGTSNTLDWDKAGVTGVNAPENGATVGATWNTNISNQPRNEIGVFAEVFEVPNAEGDWQSYGGSGEIYVVQSDGVTGGKFMRIGNNVGNDMAWLIYKHNIPFDPTKMYRARIRARQTVGTGTAFFGWAGVRADGVTLCNKMGDNTYSNQHYHFCSDFDLPPTWDIREGYTRGHNATTGTSSVGTIVFPGEMHPDVAYLRPLILVNYNGVAGITEIDSFIVDIIPEGTSAIDDDAGLGQTADWSGVSSIPEEMIYTNDDSVALGFNPTFSAWSGTFPDNWGVWTGTPTKETSNVRIGTAAVKWTSIGDNKGMVRQITWPTAPLPAGTFVSGTFDVYIESHTSGGHPGILVDLMYDSGSLYRRTIVPAPTLATGIWQRVPFTARVNPGEQLYGIRIYQMCSWSGMPGGLCSATVIFDNLRFALFDSSVDNTSISVNADGTLSGAGSGQVTITGLGYSGDLDATQGATWGSNINGQPADALLLNELNGVGAYQQAPFPYANLPCHIDCFIDNNSGTSYWFKVAEATLDSTYEALSFDGLFCKGGSSGRFSSQMRAQISLQTAGVAGDIEITAYDYSGQNLTSNLRVHINGSAATIYAYLPPWSSCLFNGAWVGKCTIAQTWIFSKQVTADNIGTATPAGTPVTPSANYTLGADVTGDAIGSVPSGSFPDGTRNDEVDAAHVGLGNVTDGAQINAPTLGARVNTISFSGPTNAGEVYFYGFNASGVAQDIDGHIYYKGTKLTVPKGYVNPNTTVNGYVIMTTDASTPFGGKVYAAAEKVGGVWTWYEGASSGTISSNFCVIARIALANSEDVADFQLYPAAMDPLDVSEVLSMAGADVTAAVTAGSGVNIIPSKYSFWNDTSYSFSDSAGTATPAVISGMSYVGSSSFRILASGPDAWCYIGANGGDYNIPITPNKKWIVSAYVRSNAYINHMGAIFVRTKDAGAFYSFNFTSGPVAGEWTRIWGTIDLTNDDSKAILLRFDNDHSAQYLYWDAVMMEEQVGNQTTPSAYHCPNSEYAILPQSGADVTSDAVGSVPLVNFPSGVQNSQQDWSEVQNKSGFAAVTTLTSANRDELLALKVIGGAFIDDLAIETAHINNGAITNAKIGTAAIGAANIGTAAVETLKIKDEAVILPRVTSCADNTTLNFGGTGIWVTAFSLNMTAAGLMDDVKKVILTANLQFDFLPNYGVNFGKIAFYRGSTALWTSQTIDFRDSAGDYDKIYSFSIVDSSPASAYYYLKVSATSALGSDYRVNLDYSTFILEGVKK